MSIIAQPITVNGTQTYLQLVSRLRQECGISGADPVTLQGQLTAEIKRLANWINTAWLDVQRARTDWFFMRQAFSFTATPDIGRSYTPALAGVPQLSQWKNDSFRAYSVALGKSNEQIMPWLPYDQFRNLYLYGANQSISSRPILFSIDPQKNILLGPIPNEPFIISGEAFLQPSKLVSDGDQPSLPSQFDMIIIYKAMMMYGRYENAPEVYQDGENNYKILLLELIIDQTPSMYFGGSLA